MISLFLNASRTRLLILAGLLIVAVALIDWRVDLNVSFGFLYLFPMLMLGICLPRWQIAAVAGLCTLLAESFDPFPWSPPAGIPRDIFMFAAYIGAGLFAHEFVKNHQLTLKHIREVEQEIELRRDAEQQLKILIESSPAAILTLDSAGTIVKANQAAHRLLGFESETLAGQSIKAFLPLLAGVTAAGESMPDFSTAMQCRGRRRNGEVFPADVWFSTYKTGSGLRLTAVLLDNSEDLRAREEYSFHRLVDGSRLAVAAVSHEIRNICSAISVVCANLSRNEALARDEDLRALGNLVEGLGKMATLELRQTADSQQLASVDLYSVLDELRIVAGPPLQESGILIRWELPEALPRVWADPHHLLQALLNLTKNSERAMRDQERKELTISASLEGERVVVRIRDTGRGLAAPELLFQPFQPGAEATGLGLYLSRAFVRAFKGDLRYQPESTGSCFVVDLMACAEQDDRQDEPEANG
jgi:PAS domain S-box-containing protein